MSDGDRNKALLRRFYEELWTKGNLEPIPELLAEDFVNHHPLPGAAPGREGLAALVTAWRTAFSDMRETCEDLIAEGDKVVGRFTMSGTPMNSSLCVPPTGRRVTMSAIDIVRVAGGKITEFWYSEHLLELLQKLDER
jgi:predicted ester cyclase